MREATSQRRTSRRAMATLLLLLAGTGCTCAPRLRMQRTRMLVVPQDFHPRSFVMSENGGTSAYVTRENDAFHVVTDGIKGPPFLEVSEPRIGPGTRRVFYWGVEDGGGKPKVTLVAGDERIVTPFERPGQITFSARGGHWAALGGTAKRVGEAIERGPLLLYRDGREVGTYADAAQPAFSPDGAHLALLIEDANERFSLVVDGETQRTFSTPKVRTAPLVKNNVVGSNLQAMHTLYLSDGTLLLVVRDESGWAVYQGDSRVASYKVNVSRGQPRDASSPDLRYAAAIASDTVGIAVGAPVAAWWERMEGEGERWRVVRNGKPVDGVVCVQPWDTDPPTLSSDGAHIAYGCHGLTPQGTAVADVVFDGRRFGPYAGVWGVGISPDAAHVVYAGDDDAPDRPWRYYVDGVPRPTRYDRVWPPRYSADGRLLFWVAEHGKRVVLMVNGSGRGSSDAVIWVPTIAPSGDLWWVVQRGQRISRIDLLRQ